MPEGTATFNHNALFNKDVTLGNGTGDDIKIEGAADFNHTLTCDNTVTFTSGTQATNTTSGALIVSGGVGFFLALTLWGVFQFFTNEHPEMEAYKCDNPQCNQIHYRQVTEPK